MIGEVEYREALARFATRVTIVTTCGADGRWWGFTASSFTSLSLDPPLILVCLAHEARCHSVFLSAPAFRVNLLGPEHEPLAARCSTVELTQAGDHTIPIARVQSTQVRGDGIPAVHADRCDWDLVAREASRP